MDEVIEFFELLNKELYQQTMDYISTQDASEESRNLYLLKLHIITSGIVVGELPNRLIKFLTQLRLNYSIIYGNSSIRPNFIGLQVLKLLQLSNNILCDLANMDDNELKTYLIKYLENDCYRNDNNDTSGGELRLLEGEKCTKCKYEKIEIHETSECDLAVCARCCFSWKAYSTK